MSVWLLWECAASGCQILNERPDIWAVTKIILESATVPATPLVEISEEPTSYRLFALYQKGTRVVATEKV